MTNKGKRVRKIEPVKQRVILELQPKKRVCAYARVSTDSIDQQGSFHAQVEYYKDFIGKRDDWEYVGIYADEAKSGTQVKRRDEFNRMIKDCETGKIDLIITKSVTRFARNTIDSIETIRKLKLLGIGVYFERENINTLSEKSEMLITILSSIAQGESETISTNVKWGIRKRFEDGSFRLSVPAYGYSKDGNGELIINKEEARIVKRIYKEYLNGKGAYLIAKGLNEDRIPTKRTGEEWLESTVKVILQNPIYVGDLLLQKTYTTEVIPFERKLNKGEMPQYFIENNHEAIISRQEGQLVDEIYEYRRQAVNMEDRDKYKNRYEFSSKIICEECGSFFRRQKIHMGKPYERVQWCCVQHIKDINKCSIKAISEDSIKDAYLVMWNKLISNYKTILIPFLDSLKKLSVNEKEGEKIRNLNEKLTEIREEVHVLSRVVTKGYMDPAVFIERQNALKVEIEAIRKKRNRLLDNNGFEKEVEGTLRLLDLIKLNPEIIEEYQKDLFVATVEKVIVAKGNQVTFKLINNLDLRD